MYNRNGAENLISLQQFDLRVAQVQSSQLVPNGANGDISFQTRGLRVAHA
jgi:hypothetical protein